MEAMFQPMHVVVLLIFGVPAFLLCRLLWRMGSKR